MRSLLLATWLAGLTAAGARAQEEELGGPSSSEAVQDPGQADFLRHIQARLAGDPAARAGLARRLMSSSIAGSLSGAQDPAAAFAEIDEWIQKNPADAARLAAGFSQDDADGGRDFEESLHERVLRHLKLSPDRYKGILGNLRAAGKESKLILKQDKLQDEEQREMLKHLFEGRGGETGRVLTGPSGAGPGSEEPGGGAAFGGGLYDRLSEANPSGYSPQVLALQNELNSKRPAGAPKIPETGRLDFRTLAAPSSLLRGELARQEASLNLQKAWALARALGREREFTRSQLSSPGVLEALERQAKGGIKTETFDRRRQMLGKASAALRDFEAEARKAQEPSRINRALLRSLGLKQKEAARWITAAAIEADLERLSGEDAFPSAELEKLVAALPLPAGLRSAYWAQALRVKKRLKDIRDEDDGALAILGGRDYLSRSAEADRRLSASNLLRKNLSRDISLLALIPSRLLPFVKPVPRWRAMLDRWAARLLPNIAYSRRVRLGLANASNLREAFERAASNDMAGAERAYSRFIPGS